MIQMDIKFLAGKVHATPWDHHVNEGVVEWPLSPWRILRALIATWHLKAQEIPREAVQELVEAMCGVDPEFAMPKQIGSGHTRHYMPTRTSTTKVFDTFLIVSAEDRLGVRWPVDLSPELRDVLETLVARIGYLGRAEAWASVELSDREWDESEAICSTKRTEEGELVRLLNAYPPSQYAAWREGMTQGWTHHALVAAAEKKGKPLDEVKLSAKEKAKIEERLPESLFDALQLDTADIQKDGWSLPPGARWVEYYRPHAEPPDLTRISYDAGGKLPQVATFALYSNVLPLFTDAFHVASVMHRALVSRDPSNPLFSGRGADGEPLKGHEHVFIFPEHESGKKHISKISLYLESGFDNDAVKALLTLTKLYSQEDEFQDQKLVLLELSEAKNAQCKAMGCSKVWESYTPFVATRHPKIRRNGKAKYENGLVVGSSEHDLRRLLAEGGYPKPISVTLIDSTTLAKEERWLKFRTHRKSRRGARGPHLPTGYRIEFAEAQAGPIALGYGAHFGLGMFVPVEISGLS